MTPGNFLLVNRTMLISKERIHRTVRMRGYLSLNPPQQAHQLYPLLMVHLLLTPVLSQPTHPVLQTLLPQLMIRRKKRGCLHSEKSLNGMKKSGRSAYKEVISFCGSWNLTPCYCYSCQLWIMSTLLSLELCPDFIKAVFLVPMGIIVEKWKWGVVTMKGRGISISWSFKVRWRTCRWTWAQTLSVSSGGPKFRC